MPVSNHCAVSALDRRVLGIRGPEGPETRPAFEEPEKNSRPARVSSALNDLWGKKPKKKRFGQPGFGRWLDAARSVGTGAIIVNGFARPAFPRFILVTLIGQLRPSLESIGSHDGLERCIR